MCTHRFPLLLHFCGEFLTVFKLCHFFLYLGSSLLPVEGILSAPILIMGLG